MKNSLVFTQHFKVRLSRHKGTSAPAGLSPRRGRRCPAAPSALPRTGGSSPATRARGGPSAAGPSRYLGGAERPPRGARPPRRAPLTSRPGGCRRRGPGGGGRKQKRPRRPHRGAVTMGRTPSPAPSGSHRRRGGGRRGGRHRHLERGARPGSRRPPSWAWRGAGLRARPASGPRLLRWWLRWTERERNSAKKHSRIATLKKKNVSELWESSVCGWKDSPLA